MTELVLELMPTIEKVAKQYGYKYPAIDPEDVKQELSLFVLERGDSLRQYENMAWIFGKVAQRYCNTESTAATHKVANYDYRPGDVKKMFAKAVTDAPKMEIPEDAREARPKRNRRPESDPMAEITAMDIRSDIREAFRTLSDEDKDILVRRFIWEDPETLETSSARNKVSRAIDRLTDEMNRFSGGTSQWHDERAVSGWTGSRVVVDNETQAFMSHPDYGVAHD